MAEPIPSASNADEERLPANAEDRKAAAALNSLNENEISGADGGDGDGGSSSRHVPSKADQEALGKAMSRLEIAAGGKSGGGAAGAAAGKLKTTGASGEEVKKKVVKVAAEDVTLLVDQLDLTKNKATELLKAHDGNATEAIKAFIAPPSVASVS